MTATLLLRLAGPLQSWGDSSRFTRRETRSHPTKSGVLGLLAAADGRRRTDPMEDLAALRFGARVDQPGTLTRDFQTAIRWSDGKSMPLSYRYYLADALFLAGVASSDRTLLDALDVALRQPAYPLYLGRRSCPVSGQVSLGVVEGDVEAALRGHEWLAADWHRRRQGRRVDLPIYLDAELADEPLQVETCRDVPLSFAPEHRNYGWREVALIAPAVQDNLMGRDEPDFMSLLGGA